MEAEHLLIKLKTAQNWNVASGGFWAAVDSSNDA
jgi:hypothetical protein